MSDDDNQAQWAAMLDTDPGLRAAWETFQATLEKKARQIKNGETPDRDSLRRAAAEVYAQVGEDQERH